MNLIAPRNYSEMSERQVRYVAALQLADLPEDTIWTRCFIRFTGIKPKGSRGEVYHFTKKGLKGTFPIEVLDVVSFSKKMEFVTRHYAGLKPISKIGKYRPVMSQLEESPFIQYLDAENFYQAYLFTQDEKYLNQLMATLYQKKKQVYNNNRTEKRSRYFARRPKVEKLIAFMWFTGIKEFFALKFTDLFSKTGGNGSGQAVPDMYSIIQNQVRMLTEGDITKREMVLQSLTWDALDEMNQKVHENNEMKSSQNAN